MTTIISDGFGVTPTPNGWIETTVFVVSGIADLPISGKTWLRVSAQVQRRNYECCRRCGEKYTDDSQVIFVFTDRGNCHVCGECADTLRSNEKS